MAKKYTKRKRYTKKKVKRRTKPKTLTKRVAKVERVQRARTEKLIFIASPIDETIQTPYKAFDVFVPTATPTSSAMLQIFAGSAPGRRTHVAHVKYISVMGKVYRRHN